VLCNSKKDFDLNSTYEFGRVLNLVIFFLVIESSICEIYILNNKHEGYYGEILNNFKSEEELSKSVIEVEVDQRRVKLEQDYAELKSK